MRKVSNESYEAENVPGHYLLDLSLENLRCFGRKQTLRLADGRGVPYHWTIILGENGTGKTSLLKALVSLAPSPKQMFGRNQELHLYPGLLDWATSWDTRRQSGSATAHISGTTVKARSLAHARTGERLQLWVEQRHSGRDRISYSAAEYSQLGDFLCFAYGASRRMGKASLTNDTYSTASVSLFDDDAPLINVEEFFLRADYDAKTSRSRKATQQRETVRKLLVDILPEVSDLRISKGSADARTVEAKTPFGWVRLSEMSLGYKSLIAWLVDFASRMYHYHRTKPHPFREPAVVLVDEIDLHMHPRWQRKILGYLSRKFPNTQFIATAHSPLIVQAALEANLVLLKRQGAHVRIENETETIRTWRIDQILTSDIFGLSSARSEDVEQLLAERRALLVKPKLGKHDATKLQELEQKLGRVPVAETPENLEAMEIVRQAAMELKPRGARQP